ncbi:MAB_1171c family putative transporter [Streptomyces sp. NPDC000070]|uniref:MAB_1171c family putative transporter n=1 Tax=Streptomyces sp. NPDC000070 TaxID=3154240 RepID=UPI00332F16E4
MWPWLETTGIVVLSLAVIVRTPEGVRNSAYRPLWIATLMIALSMAIHLPPVTALLAHLVPSPHLIDLSKHLFSVVDAAAVLWFVTRATGRHAFTLPVFCAAGAAMAMLVVLDVTAPPHARNQIAPSLEVPGVPETYWWGLFGFHIVADFCCAYMCWSSTRRCVSTLLRYSLRLFGAGLALATTLWILKLAYLQDRSPFYARLFPPVTGTEALLIAAGVLLPLLADREGKRRERETYLCLGELWSRLTAAVPDVVLKPDRRLGITTVPLRLRTYRRVIEIRDAMLVLRDHVTPAELQEIRWLVARCGVPQDLADAHVTACWLASAIRARQSGLPPRSQSANLVGRQSEDLASEIAYLLQVADAYRSSPAKVWCSSLNHGMGDRL